MKRPKRNWSPILENQETSGKSVHEYCESIGIHPNTFYKMRKVQAHPAMVEVRPQPGAKGSPIVVNLRQYAVAVRSGFDPQCLKVVLQVLGELG